MSRNRQFTRALAGITFVGFVLRLVAVLTTRDVPDGINDATYYSVQAVQLAHGHWFKDPFILAIQHRSVPAAAHPPLFTSLLAVMSRLGVDTPFGHRVVTSMIGLITVVVVAMVGRRFAGWRAGLAAAALAAIYPSLIITERQGLSEGLAAALAAGLLLASDRWLQKPTWQRASAVGGLIALLALTRSEYVLLFAVLVPLLVLCRAGVAWPARFSSAAVMLIVGGLLLAPWAGFNLIRFRDTTIISTNGGATLASAYCDETFHGPNKGSWDVNCIGIAGAATEAQRRPNEDQSEGDTRLTRYAQHYARQHAALLPGVMLARVARLFQLYHPMEVAQFNAEEMKPGLTKLVAWGWWVIAALAMLGAVAGGVRRSALIAALSILATAVVTAATVYGGIRFRVAAEPGCLVLAGVGVDRLCRRSSNSRTGPPARTATPAASDGHGRSSH